MPLELAFLLLSPLDPISTLPASSTIYQFPMEQQRGIERIHGPRQMHLRVRGIYGMISINNRSLERQSVVGATVRETWRGGGRRGTSLHTHTRKGTSLTRTKPARIVARRAIDRSIMRVRIIRAPMDAIEREVAKVVREQVAQDYRRR